MRWSADERTRNVLERPAALMGFVTSADYLHQLIAATLAGNNQSTVVGPDGELECAEFAYTSDSVETGKEPRKIG